MSILVTVADSAEGQASLKAGLREAQTWGEPMIVVNLGLRDLNLAEVPDDGPVRVIDRHGREDQDPVDAVLNAADADPEISGSSSACVGARRSVRP